MASPESPRRPPAQEAPPPARITRSKAGARAHRALRNLRRPLALGQAPGDRAAPPVLIIRSKTLARARPVQVLQNRLYIIHKITSSVLQVQVIPSKVLPHLQTHKALGSEGSLNPRLRQTISVPEVLSEEDLPEPGLEV